MRMLSDDGKRLADDGPPLGIAAYAIEPLDEARLEAKHIGVFHLASDAESWLLTGEPKPPLKIYKEAS